MWSAAERGQAMVTTETSCFTVFRGCFSVRAASSLLYLGSLAAQRLGELERKNSMLMRKPEDEFWGEEAGRRCACIKDL